MNILELEGMLDNIDQIKEDLDELQKLPASRTFVCCPYEKWNTKTDLDIQYSWYHNEWQYGYIRDNGDYRIGPTNSIQELWELISNPIHQPVEENDGE